MNSKRPNEKGHAWIREHGYDGHSIYLSSAIPFRDLGLDAAQQRRLIQTFKSDTSDPKSTIFKNGEVVKKCEGVHLLSLWYAIAANMQLDTAAHAFYGRGSQARALCDAILKELEPSGYDLFRKMLQMRNLAAAETIAFSEQDSELAGKMWAELKAAQ